jgi:broad specificity phosphatase PhoE
MIRKKLKNIFSIFISIRMKFYFIRHGHAEHNAAYDKLQDKSVYRSLDYKDSHLTAKGINQIKEIELPVKLPRKMDRVYSSPLTRCIQTARILMGEREILHLHDGLMETQGPFPCNWRPDIDTFRNSLSYYILKDVNSTYTPYTKYYLTNISETDEEMKERVTTTLEQIKKECSNLDNILIVTHNDWLESLFGRPFKNGEVLCVEY